MVRRVVIDTSLCMYSMVSEQFLLQIDPSKNREIWYLELTRRDIWIVVKPVSLLHKCNFFLYYHNCVQLVPMELSSLWLCNGTSALSFSVGQTFILGYLKRLQQPTKCTRKPTSLLAYGLQRQLTLTPKLIALDPYDLRELVQLFFEANQGGSHHNIKW